MGLTLDTAQNEMVVANYGTQLDCVLPEGRQWRRRAVPRDLGRRSRDSSGPISVAIDDKNNELWVPTTATTRRVVFDRAASGNVAPKRIIRNAPAGTPTTGFTNAAAAAYDTKRNELLVPN